MKTLIPLSALVALAASSSLFAQTPAFSKPSGYVTQTLVQGFNPIGFTLQLPPTTSGTLTAVGTSTVSDSTKDFSTLLTAGALYTLEIGSGTAANQIVEVGSGSGANVTINVSVASGSDQDAMRLARRVKDFLDRDSVLETMSGIGA